jgi:hypothetical protein
MNLALRLYCREHAEYEFLHLYNKSGARLYSNIKLDAKPKKRLTRYTEA